MASATYTFTLPAAATVASSMVVGVRARTGSSKPAVASRFQGGTFPQLTLNWAVGATAATGTVTAADNSVVDGDVEFEFYKISSNPAELTLDTAARPFVTIVDDDTSSGGGSTVRYGPTATTDTAVVATTSSLHKVSTIWRPDRLVRLRIAIDGNSYLEMQQDSGTAVNFRQYVNGSVVGSVVNMSSVAAAPSDGAVVSFERLLQQNSTTQYRCIATYGPYTYEWFVGPDMVGKGAQGQTWYGGAELWTIVSN